jgi:GTPase
MTYDMKKSRPKAVLVGVPLNGTQDADNESSLAELGRLVSTLGFDVLSTLSQKRPSHAGGTVLGDGKLKDLAKRTGGTGIVEVVTFKKKHKAAEKRDEEAKEAAKGNDIENIDGSDDDSNDEETEAGSADGSEETPKVLAEVVVFDCELTPSQLANLKSATGVEVLDRTGVIVEIFSRHAKTREAKLQVEIARLNYLAPRVRATGGGEDRMGTAGETSLELDKRKIRDRVAELKRELVAIQKEDTGRRHKRAGEPCVALVGYTNAGKSSLMRALTGSDVLVEDKLFATLDTTVRALHPESKPRILVSDTVGFIKKLPHDLVASFRSTLEEAANSSLLLFVVDASDVTFRTQLEVTKTVLQEIGVEGIPSLLILNKSDRLNDSEIAALKVEFPEAICMSTQVKTDVAKMRDLIVGHFEVDMIEEELFVPYVAQGVVGELRSNMRVLGERYEDDGVYFMVRSTNAALQKLKKILRPEDFVDLETEED